MTSARLAAERSASAVRAPRPSGTSSHGDRPTLARASPLIDQPRWPFDRAERPRFDLLLSNFARILDSEVALYYQPDSKGTLLRVISSWGLGPRHERITRSPAGGVVGRAFGAKRAALEPLDHDYDIALVDSAGEIRLTYAVTAPVRLALPTVGVLVAVSQRSHRTRCSRCGGPSPVRRRSACASTNQERSPRSSRRTVTTCSQVA